MSGEYPKAPFIPLPLKDGSSEWLISPFFGEDSYSIYITDLTTVYKESLTEDQIIERADDNESPIAVSSGPKQFKRLLDILKTSLTKPDSSTRLNLSHRKNEVSIRARIQLSKSVHLTWTFQFRPHGDLSLLVFPLARVGLYTRSLITSLVTLIKEKDRHIQALQDLVEDAGKTYKPKKLRGSLEQFDVDKWREDQREEISGESAWGVFEKWAEGISEDDVADWDKLTAGLGRWPSEDFEEQRMKARSKKIKDEETEDDEDDKVAPKASKENGDDRSPEVTKDKEASKKAPAVRTPSRVGDGKKKVDTESDEDWADEPIDKNVPSHSRTASKESAPEKPSAQPETAHLSPADEDTEDETPPKMTLKSRLGGTKASQVRGASDEEDTIDNEESPKQSNLKSRVGGKRIALDTEEEPDEEEKTPPRKAKLKSRLGGKPKDDDDASEEEEDEEAPLAKGRVRGRIGGKRLSTPSDEEDEEESPPHKLKSKLGGSRQSREVTPAELQEKMKEEEHKDKKVKMESVEPPKKELTEDEIAMQRRAQLKRELEEKQAKPTIKKRKF